MFPPSLRNLHTSTIQGRVLPPLERNSLPSGGAVNPYRKTSVFYKLHPNYLGEGGALSFNKPCQMSRVRGEELSSRHTCTTLALSGNLCLPAPAGAAHTASRNPEGRHPARTREQLPPPQSTGRAPARGGQTPHYIQCSKQQQDTSLWNLL